jgi:hypothetical protein
MVNAPFSRMLREEAPTITEIRTGVHAELVRVGVPGAGLPSGPGLR